MAFLAGRLAAFWPHGCGLAWILDAHVERLTGAAEAR
jgi:hypothetical protein